MCWGRKSCKDILNIFCVLLFFRHVAFLWLFLFRLGLNVSSGDRELEDAA